MGDAREVRGPPRSDVGRFVKYRFLVVSQNRIPVHKRLDNQNENVLAWTDTGYRFVKRQSQGDPNVWVSLGDPRPATATATAY